jgi:hypothetical protein
MGGILNVGFISLEAMVTGGLFERSNRILLLISEKGRDIWMYLVWVEIRSNDGGESLEVWC